MENREIATLGGGCFWCVEAIMKRLRGVIALEPGYAGQSKVRPTYKEVSTGTTQFVEVVQVIFDSAVISYPDILQIFFATHNPTTLNRQGADVGTQYRSVIFYHDTKQETEAKEIWEQVNSSDLWSDPIVTAIEPLENYFAAEGYHHDYFDKNKNQPYCVAVIDPKVKKLIRQYGNKIKT